MLKKILSGYFAIFLALARFVLLAAACLAMGAAIVWPLWKLASAQPGIYSLLCSALFLLFLGWAVYTKIKPRLRSDKKALVASLIRKLIVIGGTVAFFLLVLAWQRTLAISVLVLTLVVYGYLAFGKTSKKPDGDNA